MLKVPARSAATHGAGRKRSLWPPRTCVSAPGDGRRTRPRDLADAYAHELIPPQIRNGASGHRRAGVRHETLRAARC